MMLASDPKRKLVGDNIIKYIKIVYYNKYIYIYIYMLDINEYTGKLNIYVYIYTCFKICFIH